MNSVTNQLALLAQRIGEPESEDDRRFSPAQLLAELNPARRRVAELTQSLQCDDSQSTTVGGKLYNLPLDVIDFYELEYDGLPLDLLPVDEWRRRIGDDDTLRGASTVAKYHARQIQLFPVPDAVKTLRYYGYCYPTALVIGGTDSEFTIDQEEAAIWLAAAVLKATDERDATFQRDQADNIIKALAAQYKPKGPRFTKSRSVIDPARILLGGS